MAASVDPLTREMGFAASLARSAATTEDMSAALSAVVAENAALRAERASEEAKTL
jgi:cell division protein FtsB